MSTPLLDHAEAQLERDRAAQDLKAPAARAIALSGPSGATCPACGAKTVIYAHNFSKGLAAVLVRVYRYGSPFRLRDLALSVSQFNNAQKLRYWDLIEHVDPNDERGFWQLTDLGEQFVRCTARVPRRVYTYRGVVQHTDGEAVLISDVLAGYSWRVAYAREAEPTAS